MEGAGTPETLVSYHNIIGSTTQKTSTWKISYILY